jgi:lipopolysaccharide biosynthesis regulator YciM
MRRLLLSLTAASAILAGASVVPASAMTLGSAPALQTALADQSLVQNAAYTCRHRYYTSRRFCWWRPDFHRWHWRWRRHW